MLHKSGTKVSGIPLSVVLVAALAATTLGAVYLAKLIGFAGANFFKGLDSVGLSPATLPSAREVSVSDLAEASSRSAKITGV